MLRMTCKKNRSIAAVAIAPRKLAMLLWWMWSDGLDYQHLVESGSHAG